MAIYVCVYDRNGVLTAYVFMRRRQCGAGIRTKRSKIFRFFRNVLRTVAGIPLWILNVKLTDNEEKLLGM